MASIQALSSGLLEQSKALTKIKSQLHLIVLSFLVLSIFATGWCLLLLAVGVVLVEIAIWIIYFIASSRKSFGQELLRFNILSTSYGDRFSVDKSYLLARITPRDELLSAKHEKGTYYATEAAGGKERLCEIIQESCFWSQDLYRQCAIHALIRSCLTLAVILIVAVVSLSALGGAHEYSTARIVLLFASFHPMLGGFEDAYSYWSASRRLEVIDRQLCGRSCDTEPDVFNLFAEYSIVTSAAPLIPQSIYEKNRDKLNGLWSARSSKLTSESPQ